MDGQSAHPVEVDALGSRRQSSRPHVFGHLQAQRCHRGLLSRRRPGTTQGHPERNLLRPTSRRSLPYGVAVQSNVGFEHQADAERFLAAVRTRMAEFALELHPDKTRLIEFGRHAASNRAARGMANRKPSAFWALPISAHGRSKGAFYWRYGSCQTHPLGLD